MSVLPTTRYISPEEYLEEEERSPFKREYVQGEVYAMAGATDAHVIIAGNQFAILWNHLRGSSCRVYGSDMKVRVKAANTFFYPDVMVTCDHRDRRFRKVKRYPSLIVEVLSPSNAAYDRGDKFEYYSTLGSLQEYVLISQGEVEVEVRRRSENGQWMRQHYGPGDTVRLESVDLECPIEELYEDVSFEPEDEAVNGDIEE